VGLLKINCSLKAEELVIFEWELPEYNFYIWTIPIQGNLLSEKIQMKGDFYGVRERT
jgi:hypothetical protein